MGDFITIESVPVYEVQATGTCKGGLLVIHEVWGLSDHIKDVAERYGREGYHVLAPNLLSETDIEEHATPQLQKDLFDPEKRSEAQPKLRALMAPLHSPDFADKTSSKLQACFDFLYDKPDVNHKVAVVGYCFGGSHSFKLATAEQRLLAAVPYYGHADQSAEELSVIACPVLAFYGEQDQGLIIDLPSLEERMHEARIDFTAEVYTNCGHAFFNDTNPFSYNEKAANDAWLKTLDFLEKNLAN